MYSWTIAKEHFLNYAGYNEIDRSTIVNLLYREVIGWLEGIYMDSSIMDTKIKYHRFKFRDKRDSLLKLAEKAWLKTKGEFQQIATTVTTFFGSLHKIGIWESRVFDWNGFKCLLNLRFTSKRIFMSQSRIYLPGQYHLHHQQLVIYHLVSEFHCKPYP